MHCPLNSDSKQLKASYFQVTTMTSGKMQMWNYYSTDGSQANKKLHSNPQPKGRFNKNAALFLADLPSSYLDY